MVPLRTYSLGRFLSAGASLRRLAYSSSMRSIQYGAHPQPASRNATRSRGNFSGTPSKIIEVSWRICPKACEHVCVWMKLGNRSTPAPPRCERSEEHTSELQSLTDISYAVFCLKKTKITEARKKIQLLVFNTVPPTITPPT